MGAKFETDPLKTVEEMMKNSTPQKCCKDGHTNGRIDRQEPI